MLVSDCFEYLVKVWSAEMRFSFETSESTSSRKTLEVLFANVLKYKKREIKSSETFEAARLVTHQHHSSQIKGIEHLCDEDVSVDNSSSIHLFHLANDIDKPFEVFLVPCHPDEVHLHSINIAEKELIMFFTEYQIDYLMCYCE